MPYATETNSTRLEKYFATVDFNCNSARYKEVSLFDFVYTHSCFPAGWDAFLDLPDVKTEINHISSQFQLPNVKNNKNYLIEPPMPHMFNAFRNIGLQDVKVVILGQDPTPKAYKATGMAFSLKQGEDPRKVPRVLNMLVELNLEGINVGLSNGDLTSWRDQGVLLLNAALTVRQGEAGSHQGLWQRFTALLLQYINNNGPRSAWILWGDVAKTFAQLINTENDYHYRKTGAHPGVRSAAHFFGGNYFHCANAFLDEIGRGGIDWQIPPPEHEIKDITEHAQCKVEQLETPYLSTSFLTRKRVVLSKVKFTRFLLT